MLSTKANYIICDISPLQGNLKLSPRSLNATSYIISLAGDIGTSGASDMIPLNVCICTSVGIDSNNIRYVSDTNDVCSGRGRGTTSLAPILR